MVVLRLALALDKQGKYPEALKVANRAVELTQDNTAIGTPARHERDRLQQLTGGGGSGPTAGPAEELTAAPVETRLASSPAREQLVEGVKARLRR